MSNMYMNTVDENSYKDSLYVYMRAENSDGVRPAHITASPSTASGWSENSSQIEITINDFKNTNIKNIEVKNLEYRSQGGRAFKVEADITHGTENYRILFDLRDYNLFDLLVYNGCEKGFKFNSNFCFLSVDRGNLYLAPESEDFELYKRARILRKKHEEKLALKKTSRIRKNKLIPFNKYLDIDNNTYIYLGSFFTNDINYRKSQYQIRTLDAHLVVNMGHECIQNINSTQELINYLLENNKGIQILNKVDFIQDFGTVFDDSNIFSTTDIFNAYMNKIISKNDYKVYSKNLNYLFLASERILDAFVEIDFTSFNQYFNFVKSLNEFDSLFEEMKRNTEEFRTVHHNGNIYSQYPDRRYIDDFLALYINIFYDMQRIMLFETKLEAENFSSIDSEVYAKIFSQFIRDLDAGKLSIKMYLEKNNNSNSYFERYLPTKYTTNIRLSINENNSHNQHYFDTVIQQENVQEVFDTEFSKAYLATKITYNNRELKMVYLETLSNEFFITFKNATASFL